MGMIPELEDIYAEGSDITILNTYYSYPKYEDGNMVSPDKLFLIFKDNKTEMKKYKIIDKPNYTFYKVKKEEDETYYSRLFIEKEKVEPISVPYISLEKKIAEETGNLDFYKHNLANKNKATNKLLHTDPKIFFSDVNIEDHYRFKFANTYTNNTSKLYKGFFDIEVDAKWAKGDFTELGECAINCVSFYDEKSDTAYTFILKDSRNPMIEELINEYNSGAFNNDIIRQFVIDTVGGKKQAKKYNLLDTKYLLYFYDDEIDLIRDLFGTMHRCSPDFIEGWNSSAFDLEYIIARVQVLGYNPEDILCDRSWPDKIVKNYVDTRNINYLEERGDYTFISGYPVFIDQMIQYASRRKAKIGSFRSFKLDDIGLLESGVQKLDYSHITKSVTELPWLNFKTFVLYNIMDVIVQKCIETKTQDLEYIFTKCLVNNTSYKKGHRQTVYLINRMAADFYKKGFIIGNNVNKNNEATDKFLGALVGNPDNTNNYSKIKVNGSYIWLCDNLIDYDFRSLYPSIMGEFNIAPNTQIARIIIDDKVYDNENVYGYDNYNRGGEFIENLVTDNIIEFSHRWFKLANIKEMLEDINEYFANKGFNNYIDMTRDFMSVFIPISYTETEAIGFNGKPCEQVFIMDNARDPEYTYYNLYNKEN